MRQSPQLGGSRHPKENGPSSSSSSSNNKNNNQKRSLKRRALDPLRLQYLLFTLPINRLPPSTALDSLVGHHRLQWPMDGMSRILSSHRCIPLQSLPRRYPRRIRKMEDLPVCHGVVHRLQFHDPCPKRTMTVGNPAVQPSRKPYLLCTQNKTITTRSKCCN